jgi:hypothetical protein
MTKEGTLKYRSTILFTVIILVIGLSAAQALGPLAAPPAHAAVQKSLEGGAGAGDTAGAGDRFAGLLSGWGVPAITALAGCLLIGALATRNIGASVGIIAITLLSLIFLLAPQSVETFAKGIANVVF